MGYLGNKCSSSRTPQTFKCKSPLTSPYHRLHLRCVSEAPSDDPETIWLLREFYRGAVRRVIGVIIHPISSAINKQLHNKLANMNPRKQMLPWHIFGNTLFYCSVLENRHLIWRPSPAILPLSPVWPPPGLLLLMVLYTASGTSMSTSS